MFSFFSASGTSAAHTSLHFAGVSVATNPTHCLQFDPLTINYFFFYQQNSNEIKTKLSAKYNNLIIHIQLCQHFFSLSTNSEKKTKKTLVTWIRLLPVTFTQQENTGVRWAVLQKKNVNKKTTIPRITRQFPFMLSSSVPMRKVVVFVVLT